MTQAVALDSSVSVPLLVMRHLAHERVREWTDGRVLHLTAHSLAETYAVLTRLPAGFRASHTDVARVLERDFAATLLSKAATVRRLPSILSKQGIRGGAVYDALVALAAADNGVALATRDMRARATYEAIGVDVEVVA